MRIGHGYDAHRFGENRRLVLGGVEIEYEYGLIAHSDGDVLCHAIIDALFGAAGMADIGSNFPDNDGTYKDIYSMKLLEKAVEKLRSKGLEIEYIDSTVIAQRPKLLPYIGEMRRCIAEHAGISPEIVNVKATTEEKMGFTGRLEGISAHAVCILKEIM
ncbi:MAG: 2-C-methyl-D-erythritol 2,4-cyclodiphosphate synthase [Clostridia bacterium]|nr:2-C-methyl-D-erythritol 2,4-cyclodiphosphate synthase [Clostridia bacterium]